MAKKYKFTKKRRAALRKAQRKWKGMSHKQRKYRMPNRKRR